MDERYLEIYRKAFEKESEEFKKAVWLIGEYSGRKRITKKEADKLREAFETVEKRLRWKFPKVEEEYEIVDKN